MSKLGYGRWEELKAEVRRADDFRFNWFIKSRTPTELKRRLDILVRIIEKENEVGLTWSTQFTWTPYVCMGNKQRF